MNTWPLGINKEMDEHAKGRGLAHWSCTDPMSNGNWIRQDGEIYKAHFKTSGGYPDELKAFDKENPIGKSAFEKEIPEGSILGQVVRRQTIAELIGDVEFRPGDIIDMPGMGYIQWYTEEEAIPRRVIREQRQEQIQKVIAFTKRKYKVS